MIKKYWSTQAVILGFSFVTFFSFQVFAFDQAIRKQDEPKFDDMEMDHPANQKTVLSLASVDKELIQQFKKIYHATKFEQRRPVFEKYLGSIGSQGILDFLEETHPRCHGQAHLFGQALYAQLNDLGLALKECGTRCTTGCMHGVLKEAFGGNLHADVTNELVSFCDKEMMLSIHKPGSCAHGVGHAFMMTSGNDLENALSACKLFPNPALGYYCATGVYMEYFMSKKKGGESLKPQQASLHFPCDKYTAYPAACYIYQALYISRALDKDWNRVADECLKLPRFQRLGCFNGLGKLKIKSISKKPSLLSDVCGRGVTSEDQAMCIEGAIERLAQHSEQQALAACASLKGSNASVCESAAKEKMYRMNKPTIALYYGEKSVPETQPKE